MARDHEIFVAALTEDMIGGGIEGMSLNEHCGSDNGEDFFFFFSFLVCVCYLKNLFSMYKNGWTRKNDLLKNSTLKLAPFVCIEITKTPFSVFFSL